MECEPSRFEFVRSVNEFFRLTYLVGPISDLNKEQLDTRQFFSVRK